MSKRIEPTPASASAPSLRSNLILAVAVVLVTLFTCEALLALLDILPPRPPLYPGEQIAARDSSVDALIGWKLPVSRTIVGKTATYRSNAQGFRGSRSFAEPYTGRRLAFLGDSFTFGWGVEEAETFAALLESQLENSRSYNFGISGFGLDQMWMTLRHHVPSVKPDVVILSFVLEDLERSLSAYRWRSDWMQKPTFRLAGDQVVPMTAADRPNRVWRFLQLRSRLFELWRKVEWNVSIRYAMGYPWSLNKKIFAAIADECRAQGVPLLVVYIPTLNGLRHVPMFEREFASMKINFLDLAKLSPTNPTALYLANDGHLSPAGHRFAADAMASFIKSQGAMPITPSN